jgi:hypothetical protein
MLALVGPTPEAVPNAVPIRPGVTPENFARIRYGMTLDKVKEVFGRNGDAFITLSSCSPLRVCWFEDSFWVTLSIEVEDGKVVGGGATIWDDDGNGQAIYLTQDEGLFAFLFRLLRW